MKFQGLIFDLDGTIIDTADIWKKATRELIESYGVKVTDEMSEELERQLCGINIQTSCTILKKEFSLNNSVENLVEEKNERACSLYRSGMKFVEGFEQFFKNVSSRNLKMGVATSSTRKALNTAKAQLNLEGFFGQHIYDIACVDNIAKPDPAIFLYAAKKIGVDPESCFAIEDSPSGVSAAKNAGMFCIGINTAGVPDKITHADMVIDSYDQIDLEKLIG